MNKTTTYKTTGKPAAMTGLFCFLLLVVSACGQRGPLYLPAKDAESAVTETTANASGKPADEQAEDEKDEEIEKTP
jgi:predicted small lipoprotein YifL